MNMCHYFIFWHNYRPYYNHPYLTHNNGTIFAYN